jgi:hypothetical protein
MVAGPEERKEKIEIYFKSDLQLWKND